MRFRLMLVAALAASVPSIAQTPKSTQANFAARPYMGWSSWSLIRGKPTEENIKAQADALLALKLNTFGYRYINIDDGWADGFDDHGMP